MRVSADIDERSMREMYLRAFQRVVTQARPWTVMAAYNKINGVYATQNRWLLTEVLRGEWGFDGLVVSDWGAVSDRVAAVAAGLDLAMPGPDDVRDAELVQAVLDGQLDPALLERAASRVIALTERAAARQPGSYDADAHHALAREIAGRAIVLLKNDGGLLPLGTQRQSIAVLGEFARTPRYQGGGSSQVTPTRLEDALSEITAATTAPVRFAPGYAADGSDPEGALLAQAVDLAASCDVALVFAGTLHETEGADRDGIDLPDTHRVLIERVAAVNPRTVVVLSNGAVVRTSPWDAGVPALVEGWLLGQAGGGAIADVLFGRVNPSGRLAETIPLRLAHHPSYLDYPGTDGHAGYGEAGFVGYRGFDAREQDVAYPFGFGLSYTTFEYGQVSAFASGDAGIEVRVPVTNTGGRDGREVVQVYVSVPDSRVRRAPRELKAFASVPIDAGQTADVRLVIGWDDLAYWDTRLGRWAVEGGEYHCAVGASSRDLRSVAVVEVVGDDTRVPLTAESTIGEWLDDPRGAALLEQAFVNLQADPDAPRGWLFADPQALSYLRSAPLSRMTAYEGSPVTRATIGELVAAANETVPAG